MRDAIAVLPRLAGRIHACAAAVGVACRMTTAEVHARPATLESLRHVANRVDGGNGPDLEGLPDRHGKAQEEDPASG